MISYSIASLNEQWGRTPLLRAVFSGHADVACFLLENGSDVHEQDNVSMVEQSCVFVYVVHCSCQIMVVTCEISHHFSSGFCTTQLTKWYLTMAVTPNT